MKKIIILKGLPGSGKSTWAKDYQTKNPNTIRVNKDDLRSMLHDGVHSKGRENFVLELRDYIIFSAITEGHDVIVDDTNFNPIHEEKIRGLFDNLLPETKVEFEIKDFSDVPLEDCIKRDAKREKPVGEKAIRTMYNQYLKPTPPVIERVEGVKDAVMCDLDGTLCLFGSKNPYDRDFENDEENKVVMDVLQRIDGCNFNGVGEWTDIIFVSGRNDKFYDVTRKWLDDRGFKIYKLFMRKDGDSRKDFFVKQEIYEKEIRGKWNIRYVLDDRNQVVELWRSLGLTCFQVAPGDF